MDRIIETDLRIALIEGEWDDNAISDFMDCHGELFGISDPEIDPYDPSVLTCHASSGFDDGDATGDTLAYCLQEDMIDYLGWWAEVEAVGE